jgi:autotransporter translocation and assembly factor TamB
VRTLNKGWLFDTWATVHVTPNKHLPFNTSICCREIKVANGRHVRARLAGDLLLKSECGNYLYLQGVLFSPTFNKNIISAPQLMRSQDYTIIMKNDYVQMRYRGTGIKMNLKTMENLYIFIGWRHPEHALKYLASRTMNNSRVLYKTIRKD